MPRNSFALRQNESGVKVDEVCRKMGISEATFFNCKKKFGGLGVSELRRLRQLDEENSKLKQLVADLSLDKQMLQDILKKSFKAAPEARAGLLHSGQLQDLIAPDLPFGHAVPFCLVLSASFPRGSPFADEDERDFIGKNTIWLLAGLHPAQA